MAQTADLDSRSLTRFSQNEATSRFFYSLLDGMVVHHRIPSIKRPGVLLLPHGWDTSPSQDTQHEATSSISTPFGRDVSPTQDTQHRVTSSITTPSGWDASPSQDTQQ